LIRTSGASLALLFVLLSIRSKKSHWPRGPSSVTSEKLEYLLSLLTKSSSPSIHAGVVKIAQSWQRLMNDVGGSRDQEPPESPRWGWNDCVAVLLCLRQIFSACLVSDALRPSTP
jgi:hypothetical protein